MTYLTVAEKQHAEFIAEKQQNDDCAALPQKRRVGAPVGNTNGSKQRLFEINLRRAIAQDSMGRLRGAAERLLSAAAEGEPWALQMLADRLDGRPAQQVALTDGAGGPLVITWALAGHQRDE